MVNAPNRSVDEKMALASAIRSALLATGLFHDVNLTMLGAPDHVPQYDDGFYARLFAHGSVSCRTDAFQRLALREKSDRFAGFARALWRENAREDRISFVYSGADKCAPSSATFDFYRGSDVAHFELTVVLSDQVNDRYEIPPRAYQKLAESVVTDFRSLQRGLHLIDE